MVKNFYCTDACIGMSVYCYCDRTSSNIDWNITFPNGSEIVFRQLTIDSANHQDTNGLQFVHR